MGYIRLEKSCHKSIVKWFILTLFISTALPAQNLAEKKSLAVLPLESIGTTEAIGITLSNRLSSELVRMDAFAIIERGKVDEIFKEQGLQQAGCTSSECIVEIGKLLGAQFILAGSVAKIEDVYAIDTRIFDVTSGRIIKTTSNNYQGSVTGLLDLMKTIAAKVSAQTETSAKIAQEKPVKIDTPPSKPQVQPDADKPASAVTERLGTGIAVAAHAGVSVSTESSTSSLGFGASLRLLNHGAIFLDSFYDRSFRTDEYSEQVIAASLGIRLLHQQFCPYVSLDLGYAMSEVEYWDVNMGSYSLFSRKTEKNEFYYGLAAGAELFLTHTLSADIYARYPLSDTASDIWFRGALRYYF